MGLGYKRIIINAFSALGGNLHFVTSDLVITGVYCIYSYTLLGVSGRIQFDSVGDRIANATVSQWFNGVPQLIGLSVGEEIIEEYGSVRWPGNMVPSDGVEFQQDSVGIIQFSITTVLTLAAGILSVIYIVLTFVYWKRKVVRAYQPILTIAMLIGEF